MPKSSREQVVEKIQWIRILIEGVVTVGSIMRAFGIDAWWGAQKDADRREAVGQGLRSDFDEVHTGLDRISEYHCEPEALITGA